MFDPDIADVQFRSLLLDPENPGMLHLNLADGSFVTCAIHLTGDDAIELGSKLIAWGAIAKDRANR
jgi:hypothetical protein